MKKRIVFTLAVLMAFARSAWADGALSGLEVGGGARFELALGDMKEHESGNLGFNVNAAWPLPLGLSQDGLVSAVGITAETGVLFPVGKKSYIDSWWALDFALGGYIDLKLSSLITLRPELSADIRLNSVKSGEKDVGGMFADFGAKIGADVLFDLLGNGVLFKAGMDYLMLPEKESLCHYLGMNIGAVYRFN